MSRETIDATIIRRLGQGPQWASSFRQVKHIVARLRADGLIEPVAPPNGRARNMYALTDAGHAALADL